MSANKQRDGAKERIWRRVLRHWRKSGLSVRAYGSAEGLSEASFYAWRRTLNDRDAEPMGFVPVSVVPAAAVPSREGSQGGLELVLGSGRLLRVLPGFDAATLQRLLVLLEEGQP
jgi:hypothetical protein